MRSTRLLRYNFIFASLCLSAGLMAQSFGGLRSGLSWAQINTDTVRIIFPEDLRPQAQRVANTIHYLNRYHRNQIGDKAFKVDILLNNQTTISNGFVSIAPWKSHFVTTPLQDSYQLTALPWLDLLSLHEYRHVIQLSSARRGIVSVLYYLFGQESWAGAANLSLPGWFTEGDAVWAETAQSIQGRGRIPAFLQGYRALKYSNQKYRYDKVRNGSLKDFVPDHYRLGYLLVDYGQKKFGPQFWKDVMLDAAAFKGIFYPFAKAMERKSGMSPATMYDAVWDELTKSEGVSSSETGTTPSIVPGHQPKKFTDYQYPHLVGDSLLVYFERSYDQVGRFRSYHLRTNETRTIATKGVSIDPYLGGNGNILTWIEYSTNARWVEDDYTNIIKYDLNTGQRRKITRKEKYFSPQPNEDGTKIICVKTAKNTNSLLCLIDGHNGRLLKEIKHPDWIYTYPQFGTTKDAIVSAVRDASGKMALVEVNMETGQERLITPFLNRIIGIPEVRDENVFYSASTDEVENIFGTNLNSGETTQYTDEPNGAFQVAAGKSSLYYTTFTANGNIIKVVEQSNKIRSWTQPSAYEIKFDQNLLDSLPDKTYEVKPYRPLSKSFNIHTWGLIVEDPNIVARVLSNNVLNNVEFAAGVKYNYDEQNYRPFARVSVAAWYPTIDLEANLVNRSQIIEDNLRKWSETSLFGGLSVNYNLMSGSYLRSLNPSIGINHSILSGDFNFSITSLATQLTFQQQQIKARKNIFTHSGQYLQLRYSTAVDQYVAEQMQIRSGLVLRGIGRNHNLVLEADFKSDLDNAEYQFSNGLNHRGFGVIAGNEVYRLSVDYHFPLFYPDRGIGGLVYFYRLRLNPFYEYSQASSSDFVESYQSVGAELVFDMNMVNEVPFSLGIRYSYPLVEAFSPSYEIFIPVYRF